LNLSSASTWTSRWPDPARPGPSRVEHETDDAHQHNDHTDDPRYGKPRREHEDENRQDRSDRDVDEQDSLSDHSGSLRNTGRGM
jgi:hypothetical protein